MQISAAIGTLLVFICVRKTIILFALVEDPDRPCRVACQDENVSHRFYLVNGEDGWFPFGTDCTRGLSDKRSYCISGKCLVSFIYSIQLKIRRKT